MCLRYPPTVVACVCIHLACKWSKYNIPTSREGKQWFEYVDPNASLDLLNDLMEEFLRIFDKCPSKLKDKIDAMTKAVSNREKCFEAHKLQVLLTPDQRRRRPADKGRRAGQPLFHG